MIEDFFGSLTWLEGFGTVFGIVQVLLARNNNINNYLFGIISILLGIFVFYNSQLYADLLLHLYYLVMSIYGWIYWKFGIQKKEAPISICNAVDHTKALSIVLGCFILMVYWLRHHTDSDVPFMDAAVSAFAWAGMWLMAKRKLENWIYLNISNCIAIPLLVYKELYIYTGLTIFLFIVGTSGYFKWRTIIGNERKEEYRTA